MSTTEPAAAPAEQSAAERAALPESIGEHLPDAGPVVVLPTTPLNLPDTDPEETQEWRDSVDGLVEVWAERSAT